MLAFGPIPSRRLGRSLGINNIPPKVCSYSCVYCQAGRTLKMQLERQRFYKPMEIYREVQSKIMHLRRTGEWVDYLSFVPDGEPTLDIKLGHEIELLRFFEIKIAVFTNSTLLWREDVRRDLLKTDWISLKVDSPIEEIWRKTDRPNQLLSLSAILDGMLEFASVYRGVLTTETMLVNGVNDHHEHAEEIADFLEQLNPNKAYLSIPTRPPTEAWVRPPDQKAINDFYQILNNRLGAVEYLIGYEGNAFAFSGDAEKDLLSITAVHPMRAEAVNTFLRKANSDWSLIRRLMEDGSLSETDYEGEKFYMRRIM